MESNMFQKILGALFLTILVVIVSYLGIGFALNAMLNYSSVEASFHLPTHALLVGLIFTMIFCTILILDRLKR